ncbi:hypothetical protein [Pseudoalteromonas xiamenensis]
MNKWVLVAAPALSLLSGCSTETTDSKNVATEAIWGEFKVTSDGNRARLVAELNVDGSNGNNLKLTDGDKLYATASGVTKELVEDIDFFDVDYQAYFDETKSNASYSIVFERQKSAQKLISTVQLPESFTIFAPQKSQSFNLKDSLFISWQGLSSGKSIDFSYSASCSAKDGGSYSTSTSVSAIVDNGNYQFSFDQFEGLKDEQINRGKPCEVTLSLRRRNEGIIDSKYKSGSRISAEQIRTVENIKVYF